jgi:hypothetical protein
MGKDLATESLESRATGKGMEGRIHLRFLITTHSYLQADIVPDWLLF